MKTFVLVIFLGCISAYAQDPGMQANQQAMDQMQQASQQAIQQMQQTQNQQAMQQANDAAMQNTGPAYALTRQPVFSQKPGTVAPGTSVLIKCPTHYAAIYYTTNGWSPTVRSRRYKGPIVINATTQLQAIAIAPNKARSFIVRADYTVQGSEAAIDPLALPADDLLAAGTRLHLATNAVVDSKTAQVGDPISLVLNQDIKAGDAILAPKGTPVQATITLAHRAGHVGTPGDLAFEVHSLTIHGTVVPLDGGETLEGTNHYNRVRGLILIPDAGVAALAIRGGDAQIQPGMTFTAAVAKDTRLQP
jgi:Chitobiase/beta-hexosaminidase C-terminal domain